MLSSLFSELLIYLLLSLYLDMLCWCFPSVNRKDWVAIFSVKFTERGYGLGGQEGSIVTREIRDYFIISQ